MCPPIRTGMTERDDSGALRRERPGWLVPVPTAAGGMPDNPPLSRRAKYVLAVVLTVGAALWVWGTASMLSSEPAGEVLAADGTVDSVLRDPNTSLGPPVCALTFTFTPIGTSDDRTVTRFSMGYCDYKPGDVVTVWYNPEHANSGNVYGQDF